LQSGFMFSFFYANELNGSAGIMGIVNLSPDSFYEKSRACSEKEALILAERQIGEGAAILDIGAESSRPGATPVSEEIELQRLVPVISRICREHKAPVSVDTYKPAVAEKVLSEGAATINDITGLQKYPEMAKIIAKHDAGVVLMHMRGTPLTMQDKPHYEDLVGEIKNYLKKSIELAEAAGISSAKIMVDPGIGFGKTQAHNLEILSRLEEFADLGKPLLLGVSRKSFIGGVLGLPEEERLEGALAAAVIGVLKGARVIRTHDVSATCRAVKMTNAIMNFAGKMP